MKADEKITEEVARYLSEQFEDFRAKFIARGQKPPSQRDFTVYLGVNESSYSAWIGRVRPPTLDNVDKIATKLGPKIYDIMGIPPRMPNSPLLRSMAARWHKLPADKQAQVKETFDNLLAENEKGERQVAG